jgi:gamma-glutamylputrescine oxidase
MHSYWEKKSFTAYDFVIIGGGIVGLSAALSIRERFPDRSLLVLERGILPTGASTRNAGFTTFGGVGEILHDLKTMPAEDVLQLVADRLEGLRLLRERLGDKTIGYENNGGYELVFKREFIEAAEVERVNDLLYPLFDSRVFHIDNSYPARFGFNGNFIKNCIYCPYEGQLHTGQMMRALVEKCVQSGIEFKTGAEVLSLDTTTSGAEIRVNDPLNRSAFVFRAEQCIVCTNAFTKTFFPEMDITPGRGQVLITQPIPNLPFKGIFHFDEGYYYFRNIDDRVLFGGGRNLDFETEATTTLELNQNIQQKLDHYLSNLILPGVSYGIDQRWSGIMAFGKVKTPIIERVNERIIAGVRMNGIGVALGTKVGATLAQML